MNAAEAARALTVRIDDLVPALLRDAKRVGNEWEAASFDGGRGQSAKIHRSGAKAGVCFDFATGEGGDALDLVALTKFRGDKSRALKWAAGWLGKAPPTKPIETKSTVPIKPTHVASAGGSLEIWNQSARGGLEQRYLRARGLRSPESDVIRFHGACPRGQHRHPAMIALMTDPISNEPVGIHRTFVRPDGLGKADLDPNKMMLGRAGVVRLAPDEEVTVGLGIAEGIETALSIIQLAEWSNVWAACSAGGIRNFPVLGGIECLTIFADHDEVKADGKQPGIDAAVTCAERWRAAGREVIIRKPPVGQDWLDALGGQQ